MHKQGNSRQSMQQTHTHTHTHTPFFQSLRTLLVLVDLSCYGIQGRRCEGWLDDFVICPEYHPVKAVHLENEREG